MTITVLDRVRTVVLENQLSAILDSDNTDICRSCNDDWLLNIHPMSGLIEFIRKNIVKVGQTFQLIRTFTFYRLKTYPTLMNSHCKMSKIISFWPDLRYPDRLQQYAVHLGIAYLYVCVYIYRTRNRLDGVHGILLRVLF